MDIEKIVERMPEHEQASVRTLAENVLFMRSKLAETRKGIAGQQVLIPYDNGGGQRGIRENPAFKGYESLLKSYSAADRELREIIAKYTCDEAEKKREEADSPLMRILSEAKSA